MGQALSRVTGLPAPKSADPPIYQVTRLPGYQVTNNQLSNPFTRTGA